MNIKIKRNTKILYYLYEYYSPNLCLNSFLDIIETYGYEFDKKNSIIHGIFDHKKSINSILLLSTQIIINCSSKILPKIYKLSLQELKTVFKFLNDIYLNDIDELSEIIYDDYIIVNDFIINNINTVSSVVNTYMPSNIINIIDNMNKLNHIINLCDDVSFKVNNNNFKDYRKNLLYLSAKEILTHPIINLSLNNSNKLRDNYLSHNYLRTSILESFIYDYQEYKKYDFVFEISDCFNLKELKTYKTIFISIYNKSNINIDYIIETSKISGRFIIYNGFIISIYSTCRLIGKYCEYKNHKCLEVFIKDILFFDYGNLIQKIYDFNVIDFQKVDIIIIYIKCIKIKDIKVIDVFHNKYTIRIFTCLNYNKVVDVLKRVFYNRLML